MKIAYALRKAVGLQYLLHGMAPDSPYGAEHVRSPHFFGPHEREALEREWRNVRAIINGLADHPAEIDRLQRLMAQLRDIRGTLRHCQETTLTEVELFEVKRFLLQLAQIIPVFQGIGDELEGISLTEEGEALALLDPEGRKAAGFSITGVYSEDLRVILEEKRALEAGLRKAPGGSEREALLHERQRLIVKEEAGVLRVRIRLTEALRPYAPALLHNAKMLGLLDFTLQKARLAKKYGGVMPRVSSGGTVFDEILHPEVADALAAQGRSFTRVSIEAPLGATVITGANMGGKSIALQALTLNILLCQMGCFACAARAELPLFDAVFFLGEDLSDKTGGLSSFGAEILRIQQILQEMKSGAFCFVALDEPGRGTNPREGAALVRAMTGYLSSLPGVSVLATHYDKAAEEARAHYQAAGLHSVMDGPLPAGMDRLAYLAKHMDYGLRPVPPDAPPPQEALTICRLLGLEEAVLASMERSLGQTGGANGNADKKISDVL